MKKTKFNIPKVYKPHKVEQRIYRLWEKSGFFNPDKLAGKRKKTFTIVIPPPNVTGELHMGHTLNATVQDILIRWKRLQGFRTLWLPGSDHAGIATQYVVEKELKKEGLTRFDLGRKKFVKRVWQWIEKYGKIILEQLKRLGSSCDWSRTRFTLDKKYSKAVNFAFSYYYKKGLIYQGKKVVNWCPRCQTSLSELELEHEEKKGKLWHIRYPLSDKQQVTIDKEKNYIIVATTRPETMLGDAAVAVNPKDKRYKKLIGKKVILPLTDRKIPIITDRLIDPEFGTGAVKVTPAHDLTDYQIGLCHNLEIIQVIDKDGKMTDEAPSTYQGLSVARARKKIVEDLKKLGLLQKTEDHFHAIPKCYRCGATTEFIPSEQWFLKMKGLAEKAKKPVKKGKIKFYPKSFQKLYFNWLNNIKDWCISRQIWWGHKIPLKGEKDVLDTWFSSALWPFATLGWPMTNKKNSDLQKFYPTNVLSTARGILNLWVARMIFSGMEFMSKIPFDTVFIHPTILTEEGKRMSKSLGTGVDPIDLIEKYGADAVRFGVIYQVLGGQDIKFALDNIVMGRKFCNKIWNASRFVLQKTKNAELKISELKPNFKNKTSADEKIIKLLNKTINSMNKNLNDFKFGKAAHNIYDFFWHDFCDKYLEKSKYQLSSKKYQVSTKKILLFVILNSIKLLHPFIPFITEEVYQLLPLKGKEKCLMVEKWPMPCNI